MPRRSNETTITVCITPVKSPTEIRSCRVKIFKLADNPEDINISEDRGYNLEYIRKSQSTKPVNKKSGVYKLTISFPTLDTATAYDVEVKADPPERLHIHDGKPSRITADKYYNYFNTAAFLFTIS